MRKIKGFLFVLALLMAQSCLNNDATPTCVAETAAQQAGIIDNYVATNGLDVQTTASGLRYSIDSLGMGDNAQFGDTVEVAFEGFFLDGTSFGQGTFDPFVLGAVSLIPGFEEGLTFMNEGSEATFILPSILGYECFPPQGSAIGQNQILIFEVSMLDIGPG